MRPHRGHRTVPPEQTELCCAAGRLTEPTNASARSTTFGGVEPPHDYVQETSSSVVHHVDYLNRRGDHALCGVALKDPAPLGPTIRPVAVCPGCEAKLVEYHLRWWRERAEAATAELDELRDRYRELAARSGVQPRQIAGLQPPAQVRGDASGDISEARGATGEQGEAAPASLLDQARKELLELCRRFDEAVPFWRVKNSMDAFSDKLSSDERVLLAQELGAHGSLIRWCTREIEGLGLHITDNPVHGDAEDMMDAWTQDLYQPPKKTRRRLGRSRSHHAS